VNADKIYWSRENRRHLKDENIAILGDVPMGRPQKIAELSAEQKRENKEKLKRQIWIEGYYGEGKRRYKLGLVVAKMIKTSESWIAIVIVVMKITPSLRDIFSSPL
jgi:transposase, IS5 family